MENSFCDICFPLLNFYGKCFFSVQDESPLLLFYPHSFMRICFPATLWHCYSTGPVCQYGGAHSKQCIKTSHEFGAHKLLIPQKVTQFVKQNDRLIALTPVQIFHLSIKVDLRKNRSRIIWNLKHLQNEDLSSSILQHWPSLCAFS